MQCKNRDNFFPGNAYLFERRIIRRGCAPEGHEYHLPRYENHIPLCVYLEAHVNRRIPSEPARAARRDATRRFKAGHRSAAGFVRGPAACKSPPIIESGGLLYPGTGVFSFRYRLRFGVATTIAPAPHYRAARHAGLISAH